ncbi:MarR family winged helix-turn-helix transcriptional regulator [Streptosporangium roseum]|uniref:Transcriptional regulators-like protein n=1 Tax=Streptosporangium roseum (strain ATCC 12428 / DSM 43021 / JCM 3005 / KCTC 9067 / NCIMB 10171 / NRRL 2505 / NI 9100) TaxID=479432 RepID=D2BDP9_STRRD|nr:MarR family transcriptional regulator [Streptosporangium roseum]ACZ88141.1 Transcriptional regulators-like protein [Streptosporangium roseum DSM 43021]
MTNTAGVPAEEYLCTRIRRAEQALTAHHEAVLRAYGLTMTQYTVLLALSRDDGMSGAQLARACGVTQQSMATVLTGMQAKGLIDRRSSPVHAKVMIATLTGTGRRHLDGAYQEVNVLEKAFLDRFTPAEHGQFCDLLDRATETLIEQTPRPAKPTSHRPQPT